MAKRIVKGITVEAGSGNVFADLGLAGADNLKIKSGLVIQIIRALRRLGLNQEEAGRRMGISQAKVSGMLRGEFANLYSGISAFHDLCYSVLQPHLKGRQWVL